METNSYRVKFDGGSGAALAGIIDRPAGPDAHLVAVFSHCFTCNKDLKAIVRISRGLAALGIAVLRFDMTGLGGSEGDFSRTDFSSNLADLTAAIAFAGDELGSVGALIGHSFGGAASLAMAGSSGGSGSTGGTRWAPRAVVALAAPSDTSHLATLLSRMNPDIERDGEGSVSIGGRNWSIRREMLEDFRRHDLPARIARISCPTLLFHSPVDRTVGYDHALRIFGLIQSSPYHAESKSPPSASLVTLDGADHLLVDHERDRDFVTQTAAAFLMRYARS